MCCLVKKDDNDPLLVAIVIAIESLTVFRSNDHRLLLLLVPFTFVDSQTKTTVGVMAMAMAASSITAGTR